MISDSFQQHLGAFYEGARLAGYEGREAAYRRLVEEALWSGDTDRLDELAHCRCCCHEHTFEWCPARVWGGCRGQGSMTRNEVDEWAAHYERFHGLTRDEFFT